MEHGFFGKRSEDDGIEFDSVAGVSHVLNWPGALQLRCLVTSFASELPPRLLRPRRGAQDLDFALYLALRLVLHSVPQLSTT